MKKVIIAFAAVMMLTACGNQGNDSAVVTDSTVVPGPDSSQILPALTDSAKADTVKILPAQ